jgi:cell division protein ZipA
MSLYFILFAIAGLGILALTLIVWGRAKPNRKIIMQPEIGNILDVQEKETASLSAIHYVESEALEPVLATLRLGALDDLIEPESPSESIIAEPKAYIPEPIHAEISMQPVAENKATDLFVLYLLAQSGQVFASYELLQALLAVGLRYGERRIFHRYESDEEGKIIFSVATANEPGFFDFANIGGFSCAGLTLFMSMKQVPHPFQAFELMFETAQQLAEDLSGILCDEKRQPLTEFSIEDYRQRVYTFHN